MSVLSSFRLPRFAKLFSAYGLLPLLLWWGLREQGIVQYLEGYVFDRLLEARPTEKQDDRLVIITVDDEDLQQEQDPNQVSDGHLALVINKLVAAKAGAVGVDIDRRTASSAINPSLKAAYQQQSVIGVSDTMEPSDTFTPGLPRDRTGFVNYLSDQDSLVRRASLGFFPHHQPPQYSLALQLARLYLQPQKRSIQLTPTTLQLGKQQLAPLPQRQDFFEIPINYRNHSSKTDFATIGWQKAIDSSPEALKQQMQGKVVLIGYATPIKHDLVNTSLQIGRLDEIPGTLYGVEYHAHIVSQLLATALGERPSIQRLPLWGEGLWILICTLGSGLLLTLLQGRTSLPVLIMSMAVALTALGGIVYSLFLAGWWLPLVATGIVLPLTLFPVLLLSFHRERLATAWIQQRQQTINETFDAIHNGPLQELSLLQRQLQSSQLSSEGVGQALDRLDRQIRHIGASLQIDHGTSSHNVLVLGNGQQLSLDISLPELLQLVAEYILHSPRCPILADLKIKVIDFQDLPTAHWLTTQHKRQIGQFLEEALNNVGKHGQQVTRIALLGQVEANNYCLSIENNGQGMMTKRIGSGTQQAQRLAIDLKGQFQRHATSQGVICSLRWPLR